MRMRACLRRFGEWGGSIECIWTYASAMYHVQLKASSPLLLPFDRCLRFHVLYPLPLAIERIRQPPRKLVIHDLIRVVEVDAVVAVWENVHVVILYAGEI